MHRVTARACASSLPGGGTRSVGHEKTRRPMLGGRVGGQGAALRATCAAAYFIDSTQAASFLASASLTWVLAGIGTGP